METDDEVVAPSLLPASLTWATTWFAGQHLGGADEGSQRIDQRQGVQSRLRQHHGAGLPGHRGQQQHRLPVHRAVHGEHVTSTRLAGEPGLHADDPLHAQQRRVGRDRPGDRQRDGRHLHHGGEGRIGHVEGRHLEQVRGGGLRPRIDAAGIGEVRVVHAEAGRGGVHLRHEGGDAPGVPGGQQVGVVVGRMHQHAAEDLGLGDLLVQRHLRVGVVVDGGAVVVVDLGLRDRDGRARLVERQRVVVQHDIGGHQLGQAGHRRRLLRPRCHGDADGRDGDGPLACRRPRQRHGPGRDVHRPGQGGGDRGCRLGRAQPHADEGAGGDHEEEERQQEGTAATRGDGAGATARSGARARGRAGPVLPARAANRAGTAPP